MADGRGSRAGGAAVLFLVQQHTGKRSVLSNQETEPANAGYKPLLLWLLVAAAAGRR